MTSCVCADDLLLFILLVMRSTKYCHFTHTHPFERRADRRQTQRTILGFWIFKKINSLKKWKQKWSSLRFKSSTVTVQSQWIITENGRRDVIRKWTHSLRSNLNSITPRNERKRNKRRRDPRFSIKSWKEHQQSIQNLTLQWCLMRMSWRRKRGRK